MLTVIASVTLFFGICYITFVMAGAAYDAAFRHGRNVASLAAVGACFAVFAVLVLGLARFPTLRGLLSAIF